MESTGSSVTGVSTGLQCMNCKGPAGEGKLFVEVLVCPTCHAVAEQLSLKAERELRAIMTVMREAIRMALVKGELRFWTPGDVDRLSGRDFLSHIAGMAERTRRGRTERNVE